MIDEKSRQQGILLCNMSEYAEDANSTALSGMIAVMIESFIETHEMKDKLNLQIELKHALDRTFDNAKPGSKCSICKYYYSPLGECWATKNGERLGCGGDKTKCRKD